MNERLREVRKALGLNQAEFAARLGVTAAAISRIEVGERAFTNQMLITVCREYNVSEEWLRIGKGEMFIVTEDALIMQLSDKYNLDALDRAIMEGYMKLPEAHKTVIKGFLRSTVATSMLPGLDNALMMESAEEITAIRDKAHNAVNSYSDEIELARSILDAQATIG